MNIELNIIKMVAYITITPLAVYFVIKDMVNSKRIAKNIAIGVTFASLAILFSLRSRLVP